MSMFWIGALGLLALVGWMVLPSLLRHESTPDVDRAEVNLNLQRNELADLEAAHAHGELSAPEYQQACQDLERRVLASALNTDDKEIYKHTPLGHSTALTLLLAVPLIAVLGYRVLGGGAEALAQDSAPMATLPASPHNGMAGMPAELPPMDQLAERLALRLQQNPDDAPGWLLLARSYYQLGRQADARAAYAQAQAHGGEDAELAAMLSTDTATNGPLPLIATDVSIETRVIRTTENPNDGQAWLDLAQAYRSHRDFAAASEAFAKARQLLPANADLLADYADALAAANGQRLEGEPAALVDAALQLDQDHPKALWLAATAAMQRNDTQQARDYWLHLQRLLPEDSADRRVIDRNLAAFGDAATDEQQTPATTAVIQGRVDISPALRAQVQDGDTVFIFAKAVSGPPMPLAVLRKQVRDLPFDFSLDDSMAMQPQLKLSGFDQVMLGARVSRNGTVTQQPGEPRGDLGPIPTQGSSDIQLLIDSVATDAR
ncbi:MAG: c-type cytochrome biogenesis protein CcmI [Gammaproteobacteria bacterium]|nr:c-type cytochrome biogenesis protein CcmI [Gammaproteobacteria bacterium]